MRNKTRGAEHGNQKTIHDYASSLLTGSIIVKSENENKKSIPSGLTLTLI